MVDHYLHSAKFYVSKKLGNYVILKIFYKHVFWMFDVLKVCMYVDRKMYTIIIDYPP